MIQRPIFWISVLMLPVSSFSQNSDYIEKAIADIENDRYTEAIEILQFAEKTDTTNPDLYYYLGVAQHYLAYDSRPMVDFSIEWSDQIITNMKKAIALKPDYGDAYYFIGGEYGARARFALYEGDIEKCQREYNLGKTSGCFPDWLIEFGRNILKSCKPNAILITAGDVDISAVHYLQFIENYRRDVTALPSGLLNRPWFAMFIKRGIPDYIEPVPLRWSDYEILNMRPYQWKPNIVQVPYDVDSIMNLYVEPDLKHGNITLLSASKAMILEIIEVNQWKRPIHFSLFGRFSKDLQKYFQMCGLTYELLPQEPEKISAPINIEMTENVLLDKTSYNNLASVLNRDMPRASHLLQGYRWLMLSLAEHYHDIGQVSKCEDIIEKMHEYVPADVVPMIDHVTEWIDRLSEQRIRK